MVKKAWAQTPAEAVALFGKTNFKHLDFAFDFIDWEEGLPFYAPGDAWKKSIDAAMNEAQKHGIDFVVAHSLVDHEASSSARIFTRSTFRTTSRTAIPIGFSGTNAMPTWPPSTERSISMK